MSSPGACASSDLPTRHLARVVNSFGGYHDPEWRESPPAARPERDRWEVSK